MRQVRLGKAGRGRKGWASSIVFWNSTRALLASSPFAHRNSDLATSPAGCLAYRGRARDAPRLWRGDGFTWHSKGHLVVQRQDVARLSRNHRPKKDVLVTATLRRRASQRADTDTEPSSCFTFVLCDLLGRLFVILYCIVDWREITRKALIFPSSVIRASVMPSAKYSCSGLPERFWSGKTASERIGAERGRKIRSRQPPTFSAKRTRIARPATRRVGFRRFLRKPDSCLPTRRANLLSPL